MHEIDASIINLIQKHSGIILSHAHWPAVYDFVNERMKTLHMTVESYVTYCELTPDELSKLINSATVNETYFFREEPQFDFLYNSYFPNRKYKSTRIWCAACSTGEEPLSIYAISKKIGLKTEITASDIDTGTLEAFRKGEYGKNSFRKDGQKYHNLILELAKQSEGTTKIPFWEIGQIKISNINLQRDDALPFEPEYFDMVFLRNVLIYFSKELCNKILDRIWTVLKPDGILILSISEIASIDRPDIFEKKKEGSIYYLCKKGKIKKSTPMDSLNKIQRSSIDSAFANIADDKEDETQTQSIKEIHKEIFRHIDSGHIKKAQTLLNETSFSPRELEYKMFLQGMIHFQQEEYHQAEKLFYKASILNPEFWPSVVMLGYTYKHIGNTDKMKSTFLKAVNILDEYLKNEKSCYNFIVDFDPEYFISMVKKNIGD